MRPLATTANKKRPWEKAKTSILLELATNKSSTHSLGSCRSTTELRPQIKDLMDC